MSRGALALLPLALGGCLDVADFRARLDLAVGRAWSGSIQVEVADGLAAVRHLGPGDLRLWAQAPALSFRVSVGPDQGGPWTITLQNIIADAGLAARTEAGVSLPLSLAEVVSSTEKRWAADLPPGTEVTFDLAPPDAAWTSPWHFAVFGDVQEAIGEVQDIYTRMNAEPDLRFVLIAGDLTEQGSAQQLDRFQRELRGLRIPCYATLGNHELGATEGLFQERYGRGSFHFAFRGVHFTLLDSSSATLSPLVYGWLDGWLADGAAAPHVVVMHVPPIDPAGIRNGSFASRGEASMLLSRLAAGRVDTTFYGHVHSYVPFANAGIPAFITGGGGAIPERFDGTGRHFLMVNVDPTGPRLQTTLVRVYPE